MMTIHGSLGYRAWMEVSQPERIVTRRTTFGFEIDNVEIRLRMNQAELEALSIGVASALAAYGNADLNTAVFSVVGLVRDIARLHPEKSKQ